MRHPDEGEILALLEGEGGGDDADWIRTHLTGCPTCAAQAVVLEEALGGTRAALLLLDTEPPTQEARARIRERVAAAGGPTLGATPGATTPGRGRHGAPPSAGRRRLGWLPLSLPRAAMIVLFLAGGASAALPGSPVREWVAKEWSALNTPAAEPNLAAQPPETAATRGVPEALEAGATLAPEEGSVELWIHDLARGAEVTVAYVDGDRAGIFAGEGARFRSEAGRLEAWVPPGPVRVELPRSLTNAVVGSDGVILFHLSGGERSIPGDMVRDTGDEVVLRAPAGGGGISNSPVR